MKAKKGSEFMYLWTSEAVSSGHPDKMADQIADAVLDAYLAKDPMSRVACEVTVCSDLVLVTGEITSQAEIDIPFIVRDKICSIGYNHPDLGFDGRTVEILNKINKQSPEIASAVGTGDDVKAGDQGMMMAMAVDESEHYMPWAHHLSFEVIRLLEAERKVRPEILRPDAKSQATVEYNDNHVASRVDSMIVSTCHRPGITRSDLMGYINRTVVMPMKRKYPSLFDEKTKWLINPAGLWFRGGPSSDTGLSGRKIAVDQFGADCPIGGGSFSGKDGTKVDRSGCMMCRYIAKNIVAARLAKKAIMQLSYAIGVAEPISMTIMADCEDGVNRNDLFVKMVRESVSMTPKAIIDRFGMRMPIFSATASGGHFGRPEFMWERLDLVETFQSYVKKSLTS